MNPSFALGHEYDLWFKTKAQPYCCSGTTQEPTLCFLQGDRAHRLLAFTAWPTAAPLAQGFPRCNLSELQSRHHGLGFRLWNHVQPGTGRRDRLAVVCSSDCLTPARAFQKWAEKSHDQGPSIANSEGRRVLLAGLESSLHSQERDWLRVQGNTWEHKALAKISMISERTRTNKIKDGSSKPWFVILKKKIMPLKNIFYVRIFLDVCLLHVYK